MRGEVGTGAGRSGGTGTCGWDTLYERRIYFQEQKSNYMVFTEYLYCVALIFVSTNFHEHNSELYNY